MNIPELLAPAGNLEKLKIAIHYGADAVYLGGKAFGLRNLADNFSIEEMKEGIAYAHDRNVKVYLTVNSYPSNDQLEALATYLQETAPLPFDALIAADPGVIRMIREIAPDRVIHLSTQANSVNWQAVKFWEDQGICRINLAREMSLDAVAETAAKTSVELELFAHGAMCISYSGRCLLSSVMSGRNANKGECSHPCRWGYSLVEETRPGEYFPVMEDETGTFIFNSRDLCLIEHLPEILKSGVSSLKIEGRMKGIYYVASVVRAYRAALDAIKAEGNDYRLRLEWLEELCKISHRGYTTGFLFGQPKDVGQEYEAAYLRSHLFVGVVERMNSDGTFTVGVRNRIKTGDSLEIMGPGMRNDSITVTRMTDEKGNSVEVANPNQKVIMALPPATAPYDLLRVSNDL
jgi:putative protease